MANDPMLDGDLRDEPRMSSELSRREAEINLARDLAERMRRVLSDEHWSGVGSLVLGSTLTVGVITAAIKELSSESKAAIDLWPSGDTVIMRLRM